MKEEKWIRRNVKLNPERGKMLAEIQKKIGEELSVKLIEEMERKVEKVINAKQPQSEVFKIRRNRNKIANIDFPLKDNNNNIQVTKYGIDQVITTHINKKHKIT